VRKLLFASLPTLLLLGVFALGFLGAPEDDPWLNSSPLWGPGDPFYAKDPRRRNHLADPQLIWRGRPGYEGEYHYQAGGAVDRFRNNAFGFRGDELADPKPAGTTRILNVGDSATWGLNLGSGAATYSAQLARLLDASGGSWEVVNAGTVGYSSLQGVALLRRWLRDLEPDVVTVYLGNNDPAPGGLKDADRVAASAGPLQGWLRRNRFYLLLQKGVLHLRAATMETNRQALLAKLSEEQAGAQQTREGHYRLAARVTPDQYEENLREVVRLVRAAGARPILLQVPMNLVWPLKVRPFAEDVLKPGRFWGASKIEPGYLARVRSGDAACNASLAGHPYLCRLEPSDVIDLPDRATLERRAADPGAEGSIRVRNAQNAGVHLLAEGDLPAAVDRIERALAEAGSCACVSPRGQAWMLNNLGVARLQLGRHAAAFEAFEAARATWPFAMNPDYAERFHRVTRDLEVDWIDLPARFAAADPRFRGSALLHDWVHPNERGNAVIARALAERLRAGERGPR
jgi:lysophospholipase L1-like esterase